VNERFKQYAGSQTYQEYLAERSKPRRPKSLPSRIQRAYRDSGGVPQADPTIQQLRGLLDRLK
jgi:hypothetical protein